MWINQSFRSCHRTNPILFTRRRGISASVAGPSDPHAYCRELVRKHDYESFLNSYFYPSGVQRGYFATKAFSVELATVQDNVSNTVIGRMRMQFWRDSIKDISDGRPPKHPIALALYETSQRHKSSAYHLKRIIDAREIELTTPSHLTLDSFTSHAESTSSTVLYLLLSLLSVSSSTVSHAASHLGTAQTISTLLRALPYHAKQGRMVIPAEITLKHSVIQEEVFRQGPQARGIEDAVFEFATLAHDHLKTARSMILTMEDSNGKVPKEALPVFLGGVSVSNYLRRLAKAGFNVFDPQLQRKDGWLPLQIWWNNCKGTF